MLRGVNNTGADPIGGFFAVDRRNWQKVCLLGMNEAVAYLVQARGTGRDNCTTTWSVEAVERYTGISRHKAAAAVKRLQGEGLSRLLRGGTRPKYELVPFPSPTPNKWSKLSPLEQHAVDLVARGEEISERNQKQAAYRAVAKGWLTSDENGRYTIRSEPKVELDLIWLPNELVTGAAGEIPPLELVRQIQDPMTLRLLVEMYHAQNLREDGGVSRRFMREMYDRVKVGERAQLTVWGFSSACQWVSWECGLTDPHRREKLTEEEKAAGTNAGVDFFRRTAQLRDLGLIEWVPHLVESGEESGEIIHPVGMGHSDSIEDRLGRAAYEAGRALITEGQYDWAVEKGINWLAPVPRHIASVQMIGIARLRYRPHTRMTAAWWADLNANAQRHLARYSELVAKNTNLAV
jgi:hypothetical protein